MGKDVGGGGAVAPSGEEAAKLNEKSIIASPLRLQVELSSRLSRADPCRTSQTETTPGAGHLQLKRRSDQFSGGADRYCKSKVWPKILDRAYAGKE